MFVTERRTELYVILCSSEVYDETRPGTVVTPAISYDEVVQFMTIA